MIYLNKIHYYVNIYKMEDCFFKICSGLRKGLVGFGAGAFLRPSIVHELLVVWGRLEDQVPLLGLSRMSYGPQTHLGRVCAPWPWLSHGSLAAFLLRLVLIESEPAQATLKNKQHSGLASSSPAQMMLHPHFSNCLSFPIFVIGLCPCQPS